ncbi:MAG: hypothetical protein WAW17_14265, partial [Rhodococcus sp. (in: high G+C Gram-positive bacteria)]|uniref:hypothetical protein n=1 Tax=Rhodococcus sp. TaxID=1831 RepID=UPI003BAE631F
MTAILGETGITELCLRGKRSPKNFPKQGKAMSYFASYVPVLSEMRMIAIHNAPTRRKEVMAGDVETSELVRHVARELLPRTKEVADEITEYVLHMVPGLTPGCSADEVQLVHESNEQNCGAFLATLAFGVASSSIEPPAATRRLLHDLAAAGESPRHLLRGYRVGQERLWRIWSEHAHTCVGATELYEVLRVSSTHLFEFVDHASQFIVEEYEDLVASTPSRTRPMSDVG